jgi:glycosyltransferase involved in cell wall biosynthesis
VTPETAVSVRPDAAAPLVHAVETLLCAEARRRALRAAARLPAERHYAWPDVARRLEEIYERVVSDTPARRLEVAA